MFFTILSLRDTLRLPSTKVPIGVTTFVSYVVPPLLCYIAFAMLAITPQTHYIRVALWPVLALLAFRAAVSVDVSLGNPDRIFLNVGFVVCMFSIAVNTITWAWTKKPLVRHSRPANRSPSTIMDALDLTSNLRGHGWDWSRGLYVPREARPTDRVAFALHVLFSGVAQLLISGVLHQAIQTFVAGVGSSPKGASIFDETLPLLVRYLRASIISTLFGFAAHTGMQLNYDLLTLLGILLFGQEPTQWPPAFDNPWHTTSLGDFWGRGWHQFYRRTFLLGASPFYMVFGRAGGIIGAFLASALCHHIMMITLDSRSEMWRMLVGFGMMGPGVLAERAFYKLMGRRVGGTLGRIWTMTWLLLWGNLIVDGFLRGGVLSPRSAIHGIWPVRVLVDNLVIGFDAWLHTIQVD